MDLIVFKGRFPFHKLCRKFIGVLLLLIFIDHAMQFEQRFGMKKILPKISFNFKNAFATLVELNIYNTKEEDI
jgi:hypothetical protein